MLLVGTSLVLAVVIAVPVGVMQAVKRNRGLDYAGTATAFVLYSMPSYALGLILIGLFAITIKALPPEAPQGATIGSMLAHPSGLVLPVVTLTLVTFALFSRYMRSSAIENLAQDYIRTARAKGLPERTVLRRHLLRNSLIPVATLVGLSLPAVLTAGLVLEYLFNFQGLGLEYFERRHHQRLPRDAGHYGAHRFRHRPRQPVGRYRLCRSRPEGPLLICPSSP